MAYKRYERKKLDKVDLNKFFADDTDRPACCQCEHLAMCMSRVRDWNKLMDAYPNVCATCDGGGVVSYMENLAPHGAGTWNCEMWDVCGCWTNVDEPRCPRCGSELNEQNEDECVLDEYGDPIFSCSICDWDSSEKKSVPIITISRPYCTVHADKYGYW